MNGVNTPQIAVPVETQSEGMDHQPNIFQSLPHLVQALGLHEGMQPLGCGLERLLYFQKGYTAVDVFDESQENGGDFYSQSPGTFLFAVDLGSFPAETDNLINAGLSTLTSTIMLNLVRPPVHRPVMERRLLLPQFAVGRMQCKIVDNELTLHGMSTLADPESAGIRLV